MSLSLPELIDEVKELMGRGDDSVVITDARVLRWLNDAQKDIAEKCPGLQCLEMKNTSSVDTTQKLEYALADWTSSVVTPSDTADVSTENRICHIWNVWYIDGNESRQLHFKPTDEFDTDRADPTHDDYQTYKPDQWTRRGSNLEIRPLCSCSYCDKDLRIDCGVYPREFTATDSTEASVLDDADEGLILYAQSRAWSYCGGDRAAQEAATKWAQYLAWQEDYKNANGVMHEWYANIYD